jgi:hypothetical protein
MKQGDRVVYVAADGAEQEARVQHVGPAGPTLHRRLDLSLSDGGTKKNVPYAGEGKDGKAHWREAAPEAAPVVTPFPPMPPTRGTTYVYDEPGTERNPGLGGGGGKAPTAEAVQEQVAAASAEEIVAVPSSVETPATADAEAALATKTSASSKRK